MRRAVDRQRAAVTASPTDTDGPNGRLTHEDAGQRPGRSDVVVEHELTTALR